MKRNLKDISLGRFFSVVFVCFVLTAATLMSAVVLADDSSDPNYLSYTFSFKEPDMKSTELYNEVFTKVSMSGCMVIGKDIGSPSMPVKFIKLLLPPGKNVANIEVIANPIELSLDEVDLTKQPVVPYQLPIPFGEDLPDEISFTDEIYDSHDLFPSEILKNQGVGYSRGYAILTIALNPLQYISAEGSLFYYPEMTVNIELEGDGAVSNMYRDNVDDEAWVKQLVWNPELVDCYQTQTLPAFGYPGGLCDPSDSYDYVIITTTYNGLDHWATSSSLPYNWTSLMDKHETQDGLSCTLLTMQEINACSDYYNSSPVFNDTQAHIREFCRDAYQDWGTSYIFIGGDDEWLPAREMDYDYESNVEADIYWNHLDKTFNDDGDNDWGEEGDSGFDLYSEMYIGRITCDEPQDVSNWMTKSFYYADSFDKDYLENAGFYGGNTGWSCQGDDFIDYSAIKGTNNWLGPAPGTDGPYPAWGGFQYGFETWNILNTGKEYNMSVMWTAEPPNPGWQGGSESQAIAGLKNAISSDNATLIAGIAHANADMSLDVGMSSWESDYHNTKPFFLHDYGCHCGDPDASDDGVLHSMLFHSDTELAFGCVYNTGYGWGNFDDTNSSSALQQKLFWDYFFDTTNNSITPLNWQLGKAMAYSKDEMAPTINWTTTGAPGSWRGIIESCLLFGDPAQKIKPPFQPEHGIAVVNLDVDDYVAHGETVYVGAMIINVGSNNETNILVNFTVNGTILDYITISLDVGQSDLVSFAWNPDYGTYLVGVESQPVPGENITDNNAVNKTVHVIPAPDIWVSPGGFDFHVNAGESDYDALTVGNEVWAETSLLFDVSVSGGSWLSVLPDTGVVSIDDSMTLNVSVDAATLTEGNYYGYIDITSNDLDEPILTVVVNLSVVFADDVGVISVNSPVGQQVPGSYIVNATVENFGSMGNTFDVNCSIYEAGGQLLEDFEANDGGYNHGDGPGTGSIDDWEWGTPTYGPSSAHSGSNCWATNLDSDHSNSADGVLDSISIDLNMYSPLPELTFWHWYDHTTYDCGNVKISTDSGASWSIIYPDSGYTGTATSGNQGIPGEPAFTDVSSGWEQVRFNLSGYEGETVMFRWHFGSTSTTTHPGWYVDDVELSSSLIRGPGDLVYSSIESVYLPAYSSGFIEFSPAWYVTDLSYYVIDVTTMLSSDEDISNDGATGVVEISSAPEGHIAMLSENWNFVALPFNQSVNKGSLIVNYNAVVYTWSDAVNAGVVNDFIFGWNRAGQSYNFADALMPGYGYWVYAFENCELKAPVLNTGYDGYITDLYSSWNIVGIPDNIPVNKSDIIVNYGGTDYTWNDAVVAGHLNGNVFGWDRMGQSYNFADMFEPGYAYWIYAYSACRLKQ